MNELQLDKINIEDYIFGVRGKQVMLANDLAKFLNMETKRINEVVKRNKEKFSNDVCF